MSQLPTQVVLTVMVPVELPIFRDSFESEEEWQEMIQRLSTPEGLKAAATDMVEIYDDNAGRCMIMDNLSSEIESGRIEIQKFHD